jgi:glutamate-1-semialdehyde 2,1-aminomutase
MNEKAERETSLFQSRTPRSSSIFKKNRLLTPYGVHSNYRFNDPYPVYFKKAKGSRIWDVDGNEYVDFCMAFGALVAGHAHPLLTQAMAERIRSGTIFGFETEEAYTLAKIFSQRFSLDMVRFSSTGLEGTMAAIRLARAHTKRKKILKFEGCYHGSHDALLVSIKPSKDKAGSKRFPNPVPASQGVPEEAIKNTVIAPFNDIEAVEELMKRNEGEIAGVILEPIPMNMGYIPPKQGFLEGLRKLCSNYESALIFDEVKTSGKFYRGAAGHFGVKPDLAILGKAIAGGYPLSVLGGRKEVMETIVPGVVAHAGTFNSNPLSVTAGIVTLSDILTENAMQNATKLGDSLSKGYQEIIEDSGIQARIQGSGLSATMYFSEREVTNWRDFLQCDLGKWWVYYTSMMNHGVIPMATGADEQWTVSVQHTKEDIEKHLELFEKVAHTLRGLDMSMPIVEAI